MVYKLKTNPNNTWNIDFVGSKIKLIFVEEILINIPFETLIETHHLPDKTVYSGVMVVETDNPLIIKDGKVIFE